ncbi:MAG TPA: hypothetical protein VF746_05740 [Longimicrobium sp.]
MYATLVSRSALVVLTMTIVAASTAAAQGGRAASPVGTWAVLGPLPDGLDSARLEVIGPPEDRWGRLTFFGRERREMPLVEVRPAGRGFAALLRSPVPSAIDTLYFGEDGAGALATFDRRTPLRIERRSARPSAELAALAGVELVGPGVISTARGEGFGSFTPDGREFYFARHTPNWGRHTIMVSRLAGGRWTEPEPAPFSGTGSSDREPFVTADGRRLLFGSNRPHPDKTDRASYDLWVVERRPDGSWGAPERLPAPISTEASELHPVLTASGALYFSSNRPGGLGLNDVWRSRWENGRWSEPENLGPAVNSPQAESNAYVTPDERAIVIVSDSRPGGLGGDDLWLSVRGADGRWTPARHLPAPVNSFEYEYGPTVSPDGRWLYFTSHRRGTADIYRVPVSALGIGR